MKHTCTYDNQTVPDVVWLFDEEASMQPWYVRPYSATKFYNPCSLLMCDLQAFNSRIIESFYLIA